MTIIKTASELYREIKNRGLELRKENGRDNDLIKALSIKVGCPDNKLQSFLDNSELTSKDFLIAFLEIAEPFALMFKEIWDYLSINFAPNSLETLTVEFGFDENKQKINLDIFRRYAKEIREVFVINKYWSYETFLTLFEISWNSDIIPEPRNFHPLYENNRYRHGQPFNLPKPKYSNHPFDILVKEIHGLFDQIIKENIELENRKKLYKGFDNEFKETDEEYHLRKLGFLLTDLLPSWFKIFINLHTFSIQQKRLGHLIYLEKVDPKIKEEQQKATVEILKSLDVLDLPFWKNRWHTYEIWSTVLILNSLEQFKPKLNIVNGRIPIDGYTSEIIATLKTTKSDKACIGARIQTEYISDKRKAVNPDIRILFQNSDEFDKETACIIEFKQRKEISNSHIFEVANSYLNASPNAGGVVITNYDKHILKEHLPKKTFFIDNLQPQNTKIKDNFKQLLIEILKDVEFEPIQDLKRFVLLDISGSMQHKYNQQILVILNQILKQNVKVLKFNDGLIDEENNLKSIQTFGGTHLGKAIEEIEKKYGFPDKLLVITDGEHDNPNLIISKIAYYKECMPDKLAEYFDFIIN